jgi:hypothetical protein
LKTASRPTAILAEAAAVSQIERGWFEIYVYMMASQSVGTSSPSYLQ